MHTQLLSDIFQLWARTKFFKIVATKKSKRKYLKPRLVLHVPDIANTFMHSGIQSHVSCSNMLQLMLQLMRLLLPLLTKLHSNSLGFIVIHAFGHTAEASSGYVESSPLLQVVVVLVVVKLFVCDDIVNSRQKRKTIKKMSATHVWDTTLTHITPPFTFPQNFAVESVEQLKFVEASFKLLARALVLASALTFCFLHLAGEVYIFFETVSLIFFFRYILFWRTLTLFEVKLQFCTILWKCAENVRICFFFTKLRSLCSLFCGTDEGRLKLRLWIFVLLLPLVSYDFFILFSHLSFNVAIKSLSCKYRLLRNRIGYLDSK